MVISTVSVVVITQIYVVLAGALLYGYQAGVNPK